MRARLLAVLFLLTSTSVAAQEIQLRQKQTRWRIGYEAVDLKPDGANTSEDLGLVGVHYDLLGVLDAFPPLYVGAGGFAQVTGDADGFYLAGLTLGGTWSAARRWTLDTGIFYGGGGGTQGAIDTGFVQRPFFAIERALGLYGVRAEVAYFDFDDHEADWTASIGISLASEHLLAHAKNQPKRIPSNALIRRKVRVTPRTLWLDPSSDSKDHRGQPLPVEIGTVGVGIDYFLDDTIYFPVEAYGAVRGNVDGFVLASVGVGMSVPVITRGVTFDAAVSAISGGGGAVATGGGIGWHARAGFRVNLFSGVALELLGGALKFPGGDLDATTASVGLSWNGHPVELAYNYPRGNLAREGLSTSEAKIQRTRIVVESKFYSLPSEATKKDGTKYDDTITLAGVGIEEPVTDNISLTARVFAAVAGGSGGYTEGLLGVRYDHTLFRLPKHHFGIAAEFGAAGGGGADVGSGLIAHVSAGWRYDVTDDAQVSLAWGKVEANHGSFEAESVTAGLNWNLSRAVLRD